MGADHQSERAPKKDNDTRLIAPDVLREVAWWGSKPIGIDLPGPAHVVGTHWALSCEYVFPL